MGWPGLQPQVFWNSGMLETTPLTRYCPGECGSVRARSRDCSRSVTARFDFSDADRVPPDQFNRVIWKGLMGRKPYPTIAGLQTSRRDDDDR